jgi:hypothetical protein
VWDHLIAFGEKISSDEHTSSVRGHRFDNNHRRTALCSLSVVAEVPFPRQAFMAHVDRMRPEHDSTRELTMPEF